MLLYEKTWRALVRLTVPVFMCQLVTQLYTTVDSVIVGRYMSQEGLAAIGVTYPIILLAVSLGIGFLLGISVAVGECIGSGDEEQMRKTVAVAVIYVLITYVIKLVTALYFTEKILKLINTPAESFDAAASYLRIVFIFGLFTFGYSMCTYILRALGDAVKPMYFLIGSSILNVFLDLLFVAKLHYGVEGAAIATVISESLAMVGCLIYMWKAWPQLRISLKDFRSLGPVMKYTFRLSWPSSIQMSAVTITSILVQATVNKYGVSVVAGLTAAQKIEQLITMAVGASGTALLTFSAQNRGAGYMDRVDEAYRFAIRINAVISAVATVTVLAAGSMMISWFTDGASTDNSITLVATGVKYFRYTAPFYIIYAMSQTIGNYLRGIADAMAPLWIGAVQVGTNLTAIFMLEPLLGVKGIWISVPIAWCLSAFTAYQRKINKM